MVTAYTIIWYQVMHEESYFDKAYMKSYIPLETAAIFFSSEPLSETVLARSMPWLTSFTWAYLTCDERKPRITK